MTARAGLGSTYRLQLNGPGFTGAAKLVPYLHDLGIETLYVSPILAAAPGSTHGYDVIDPTQLDRSLGSMEEFTALLEELDAHDMRLLLDIVPNHMAAEPSSPWWWDTLRRGTTSPDADVFDIDWSRLQGQVLLPVLSSPLADLTDGASVCETPGGPVLQLDGQTFPLRPDSDPETSIDRLLTAQHYRPAYWRRGDTEGNYRRFFNIDGLVGVRVEDPEVFQRTHDLILRLCADERIAGVRVDHIDGLLDPTAYLARLGRALDAHGTHRVLLVEKILQRDESLPQSWVVDGTTGYEFADRAGGLFLEPEGCRVLSSLGHELTGEAASFEDLSVAAKREALDRMFSAQLDRVVGMALNALDSQDPGHDLAALDLRRGLIELTVSLPVYRTYLNGEPIQKVDEQTLSRASGRSPSGPSVEPETERAMRSLVSGFLRGAKGDDEWAGVAMRWQQLSGAVMAKGVEDTASYRYNGLLSHADVGCDPDRAVCGAEEFHRFMRVRARTPGRGGLNSTSTHDSKRNEDARCRLAVLSEAASEWGALVRRWHRRYASPTSGTSPHDELAVHQALCALWPVAHEGPSRGVLQRVQQYALKAAREAKRDTSWTEPSPGYERTLRAFITRVSGDDRYCIEMGRFVRGIGPAAASNSLSLTVLKTCTPGVPDFFQGTELFEPTLTDPDNRRRVDFSARRALLRSLPPMTSPEGTLAPNVAHMVTHWPDGQLKIHVIRAVLQLRHAWPDLFAAGSYAPLDTEGSRAENVVAWMLRRGGHSVIAIVPRLTLQHAGRGRFPVGRRVWGSTTCRLPKSAPHSYVDTLTGRVLGADEGRLAVADALRTLPVAVLRTAARRG